MKKRITIIKVVAWIAYISLMVAWVIQGATLNTEIRERLTWPIWASAFLMILAFYLLEMSSFPKPKIKKGRYYTLEKVVPHDNRSCSIVLSYDNKIEIYKCEEIYANSPTVQAGNKYLVKIENGTAFFTP